MIGGRMRTTKNGGGKIDGAQGRNRTTDTCIFSAVLYQLSYLGAEPAGHLRRREVIGGWR
jgi:hypothetical protein